MPTYVGPGVLNPYSSGTSGGTIVGDASTGQLKRDVSPFIDALEAYDTPTLDAITKSGVATQVKHEWGIKNQRPLRTTLGASYTSGGTTLTFASGFGPNLMKYQVFKILDATNGDEFMWASSERVGDTITVVFAQGGTLNASHASGLTVELLQTAQPLTGPDHPISPIIYGGLNFNYCQRDGDSFKIDRVANATSDLEKGMGDRIADELTEVARIQKIKLNKALLAGGRQLGAPATPTAPMMGGIKGYLTTNATNLSSATLSIFDIDTITSTVWSTYRNNVARRIWMSLNSKRILSRLFILQRDGNWQDKSINTVLNSVEFETGKYEFIVDPYMPDGELWGIDTSGIKLMPYKDNDWHTLDLAITGEYIWKSLSGTFTMEMNKEPLMWRLYGFDTTLSNYPVANL